MKFNIRDNVFIKGQKVATVKPTKLQNPRKKDPLAILAKLTNVTYRVKS